MIIGNRKVYAKAIPLHEKLETEILSSTWNSITLCSAFLTKTAAESIIELIDNIKTKRKIKFTFIIGIKNYFTVPEAIRLLIEYINSNNRRNLEFKLMLPRDVNFHMKCYVFLGRSNAKVLVGSANLTDTGLESIGELMVEVNETHAVDNVIDYIDCYLNDSESWIGYIDKYEAAYKKVEPEIRNVNFMSFFKKPKVIKSVKRLTIRFTAPTMDTLDTVRKDQSERVNLLYSNIKELYPDINKSNWIIYPEQSNEQIREIKENYPVSSCFDRPRDSNTTWEIGAFRMICSVGAVINTLHDEVVIFMKKGCIHYRLTEKIIEAAEKFGIKCDGEDYIPTKQEMDKYKQFVLDTRNH